MRMLPASRAWLAMLLLSGVAWSQGRSDADFGKDVGSSTEKIRERAGSSKAALKAQDEERERQDRRLAAGDYDPLSLTSGLRLHKGEDFRIRTLSGGADERDHALQFLYEKGLLSDTLRFVRVQGGSGELAVWNAPGLERAGLTPGRLRGILEGCQGGTTARLIDFLREITAVVAEEDPAKAADRASRLECGTILSGEKKGDVKNADGSPGPTPLPPGEKKGDSR